MGRLLKRGMWGGACFVPGGDAKAVKIGREADFFFLGRQFEPRSRCMQVVGKQVGFFEMRFLDRIDIWCVMLLLRLECTVQRSHCTDHPD